MSLDRLKWLTIILPILFMAAIQACLMLFLEPTLGSTLGHWVALGVIAAAVIAFSTLVFRVLNGMQREIIEQNEQAQALYEIGLKITSLQDIQQILRFIVEQARAGLGRPPAGRPGWLPAGDGGSGGPPAGPPASSGAGNGSCWPGWPPCQPSRPADA